MDSVYTTPNIEHDFLALVPNFIIPSFKVVITHKIAAGRTYYTAHVLDMNAYNEIVSQIVRVSSRIQTDEKGIIYHHAYKTFNLVEYYQKLQNRAIFLTAMTFSNEEVYHQPIHIIIDNLVVSVYNTCIEIIKNNAHQYLREKNGLNRIYDSQGDEETSSGKTEEG